MKILYDKQTGKVYYAVRDMDYYWFRHTTNIPLDVLEIEENDINQKLCLDIIKNFRKFDESGNGKFTISNGKVVINNDFIETETFINVT